MAEMDIVPYIGTRTPADFDTLFDELETARGTSASLSDAIGEKADAASTLSGYGITDAYTKAETNTALGSKQDALSQSQLAAVNSGITAEKLAADESALAEVVDAGAKNIVHTQDITRQGKGYIATPNGDGTYTITGSRTDAGSAWFEVADVSADAGSYILSGGVTGIPVAISVSGSVVYAESSAQEINAEISNKLYIHIPAEFNQSNINYVIKPMICTKAVWYISQKYVPYAPTNRELYAMIQALQNGTRSASALAKAEPEEIKEPETGEEETR